MNIRLLFWKKKNTENENVAKRAFEFSQKELENGNYKLAQTYMLNAITHHSDLKYLSFYLTIIKKLPIAERNAYIEQAINLYSIALFNNPPEEVNQILSLIETFEKNLVKITNNESADFEDNNIKDNEFIKIENKWKNYTWENLINSEKLEDTDTLSERVNILDDIIQTNGDYGNFLSSTMRRLIEDAPKMLQETKIFIEYIGIKKSVEQYLHESKLEIVKTNYNSQYIACRLQQANSLLSQLWLFDVDSIIGRKNYLAEQLNNLQKEYECNEKIFLEKESESICKSIKSKIADGISDAKNYSHPKITAVIQCLQKCYEEISIQISAIPLKSKMIEMQAELQKLAEIINDLSRKRYAAYQMECAKICRNAIQLFEDITWVWERDVEEILRKCPLDTINEALICPETATILQMTKQILEDKLSMKKKADFAVKCIEATKMRLEDF